MKKYGKRKTTLKKKIKEELLSIAETKTFGVFSGTGGPPVTINEPIKIPFASPVISYIQPIADILQGSTQLSRVGNEALLVGTKLNVVLTNAETSTWYVRVAVISVGDLLATTTLTNAGVQFTDIDGTAKTLTQLQTTKFDHRAMTLPFLKGSIRTHFNKVVKLGADKDGKNTVTISRYIKHPLKLRFTGATAGTLVQSRRLYFVIFPFPEGGGTPADVPNLTFAFNSSLKYKDL